MWTFQIDLNDGWYKKATTSESSNCSLFDWAKWNMSGDMTFSDIALKNSFKYIYTLENCNEW